VNAGADPSARARRFARQILVLGDAGQAAIERRRAAVGGPGAASCVAGLYAERAGFAAIEPGLVDRDALAPCELFGSEAARDVVAASRAVLHEMIRASRGDRVEGG
jgi:hypothetical protein